MVCNVYSINLEAKVHRLVLTAAIFFAALSLPLPLPADSTAPIGITLFRTDLTVLDNGTLEIVEEIALNDASSFYKYGFTRVLPISAEDRWDTRYAGKYRSEERRVGK